MKREPWGIYCRISQARRKDKDGKTYIETLGVERQEPPCRELVERMGGEVMRVFIDNDTRAFENRNRPHFQEMLAWAREGRIKGIAAWDSDRLSREPLDNEAIIALSEQYGTRLATAGGTYDLSLPDDQMLYRFKGAIDKRESQQKRRRLKLKHDQKAAAGLPHGHGNRPFGFERDGLTINQAEAALIREASRRILDGEPVAALLADWRARNIKTPRGNDWKTWPLRTMLRSPRIAGLRQHRGKVIGEAAWPAIIDLATRNRLLTFYAERDGKQGQRVGRPAQYLYSNLLTCHCGRKMFGTQKANGKAAYKCPMGPDHRGCGASIDMDAFEAHMEQRFIDWIVSDEFRDRVNRRLAELQAGETIDLDADRQELDELQAILPTRFATDAHRVRATELEARLEAAEGRLRAVPALRVLVDLPATRAALERAWRAWSLDERRARLRATVESIEILPGVRGHANPERRIRLHWR